MTVTADGSGVVSHVGSRLRRASSLGTPPEVFDRVRRLKLLHLPRRSRGEHGTERDEQDADRFRLALLEDARAAVVRLRDTRRIDHTVLRPGVARLDAEELRLFEQAPGE